MKYLTLLLISGCATAPSVTECDVARFDAAAAEACLLDPVCAVKFGSPLFLMRLDENRRTLEKCR